MVRGCARSADALIERLLELTTQHGFPKLPDDPCALILPFEGGGTFPVQYSVVDSGHEYYLRWRYAFSIDIDNETVYQGSLDVTTSNELTFRETNVVLAIVSEAILAGQPLSELVFPDATGFLAHPQYRPGRSPLYMFPDLYDRSRRLELRDHPRWYRLWHRRQRLLGAPVPPEVPPQCQCGVAGMSCGVAGCDVPPG